MQSQETLSGDFGQQPLATVLAALAADTRSGVLVIDGGGEVWIDNGSVYLAVTESSNQIHDVLFASGVSSESEIAELLTISPSTVKTHLAALFSLLDVSNRTEATLVMRELEIEDDTSG